MTSTSHDTIEWAKKIPGCELTSSQQTFVENIINAVDSPNNGEVSQIYIPAQCDMIYPISAAIAALLSNGELRRLIVLTPFHKILVNLFGNTHRWIVSAKNDKYLSAIKQTMRVKTSIARFYLPADMSDLHGYNVILVGADLLPEANIEKLHTRLNPDAKIVALISQKEKSEEHTELGWVDKIPNCNLSVSQRVLVENIIEAVNTQSDEAVRYVPIPPQEATTPPISVAIAALLAADKSRRLLVLMPSRQIGVNVNDSIRQWIGSMKDDKYFIPSYQYLQWRTSIARFYLPADMSAFFGYTAIFLADGVVTQDTVQKIRSKLNHDTKIVILCNGGIQN
jgi:hypothetical protein